MPQNPFKPTAGKMPPILIGRESIIEEFEEALEDGAGAPGRLMLITGQRGYGKTVLLTELGRIARKQGWFVVSETASSGLVSRLMSTLGREKKVQHAEIDPSVSIAGVASVRLGKVSFSSDDDSLDLRSAILERLKKVPKGKGVFINIDETQGANREELVAIGTAIQHVIRDLDADGASDVDKKGVAVLFAGLPSIVDEITNNKLLTFLRRSTQRTLEAVPTSEVAEAYIDTVSSAGMSIDREVALYAAEQSYGYPYMIQLVGYYLWREARRRNANSVELQDVQRGLSHAVMSFGDAVCAPAYSGLGKAQRNFLDAMATAYPSPAKLSDIASQCGKSASWASKYRASLVCQNLVRSAGHGMVEFAIPHFGDYLKRRAEFDDSAAERFKLSTEPSRSEYAFVHWVNGSPEFVDIDDKTGDRYIALLRGLLDFGFEGDELLNEFSRYIKLKRMYKQ